MLVISVVLQIWGREHVQPRVLVSTFQMYNNFTYYQAMHYLYVV